MILDTLRRHCPVFLATLAIFCASPMVAAEHVLTLDAEGTTAHFTLGATGHDVHGNLYLKSGTLQLAADGTASGQVALDAVKTETGNKRRDKKMHTEVLVSEKHPMIVFEAEGWSGDLASEGASDFEISGTMTLVGQGHAMTLPIHVEVKDGALEGNSTFSVPFIEWGLEDPSILFLSVAKEVEVTIEAVGRLTSSPASSEDMPPSEDMAPSEDMP